MPTCARCGDESPERARFCLACGAPLADEPAVEAEERKVVSVLFVDLVGFTARSEGADPEDVRARLRPYHARVKQEIERFGGTVEKFVGDAVMAVFGAPVAHEDDAERAVRAGLHILDATDELGLEVRAAVNTGEAVVSLGARPEQGEGIVAGDVVNTAARLQAAAPSGALVVGELTYRATRDRIDHEELEPVTVKGKAEPVPLWRAREARSRFGIDVEASAAAPFIGRDGDLALLEQTYARTLRERSIQLVTVMGEPGVGKTRLVSEFRRLVDGQPDLVIWRQGGCLPYGEGITFWALGEMIKAHAGILESDSADEATAKLEAAVAASVEQRDREWVRTQLALLVGAAGHGDQMTERTEAFAGWRTFLEGVASQRPLVLVFEDLHWADSALLAFVQGLVDWTSGVPLLVLCTARPELYEREPAWGGGKRNSTTLSLSPLAEEDTARLVAALLQDAVLPAHTQAAVLERAGGNPLYAEEFVRMLAERGLLRGRAAEIPVPENLQALIAGRLDTLPPESKALLHDAAVIGKVFWARAVASMGDRDEGAVREGLHELAQREFVRRARTSSVVDEVEYSFGHVLVRDVAYGQIPRSARARKHVAAAKWIEGIAGDRVVDHAELLAYHYATAIELTRAAGDTDEARALEPTAARFLVMAGDRAAPLEPGKAEDYYRRALVLMPPDDAQRPGVLLEAAETTMLEGRKSFDDVRAMFEEASRAYRAQQDPVGAADALRRLSYWLWVKGESAETRAVLLAEARRLVEQEPPGPTLALVYAHIAHAQMLAGRARESLEWCERAIPLLERFDLHDPLLYARTHRGIALCNLGDIAAGLAELRAALDEALAPGRAYGTLPAVAAHSNLAEWEQLAGKGLARALELANGAIELAKRRGAARPEMWHKGNSVGLRFELGRWEEALKIGDQVKDWDRAQGGSHIGIMPADSLALILTRRGQVPAASALIRDVMPRAREAEDPQLLIPLLSAAAIVENALGRLASAISLVVELEERTRELSDRWRVPFAPDALRVCAAAGELSPGARLLDRLHAKGKRLEHAVVAARAILAEAKGDTDDAARLYSEAAERWRDYGFVLEEALARLGAGRCRVMLGGHDAGPTLHSAREIFTRLGAHPLVAETDTLLTEATASPA